MRITPIDIQNKQFRAARMRGYNADDVDSFLDEIAAEIESAGKEIGALQEQLKQSKTELTTFEELKGTLNSAIINAQVLADDIRARAEVESTNMLAEANQKVEEIQAEALARHQSILTSIDRLAEAEQTFRDRFMAMLSEFEGIVSSRDSLVPTAVIAEEAAVSAVFAPAAPAAATLAVDEAIEAESDDAASEPILEQAVQEAGTPWSAQAEIEASVDSIPMNFVEEPAPAVEPEIVAEAPIEQVAGAASVDQYELADVPPGFYQVPEAAAEPELTSVVPVNEEAPEAFIVPEVAPAPEVPVLHEIAPEPAPAYESAQPAATFDLGGAQVADDLSSKDEIAEAVERMRRMLGEAGVDPNPTPAPVSAPAEDGPSLFEENSAGDNFGAGAGFGDLGEGVPGVRKRKERSEGSGSEVD